MSVDLSELWEVATEHLLSMTLSEAHEGESMKFQASRSKLLQTELHWPNTWVKNKTIFEFDLTFRFIKDNKEEKLPGLNINNYATRKTLAQGMLDLALLTANAAQLKRIMTIGPANNFYYLLVTLISISILLQVVVAYLIFISRRPGQDFNDPKWIDWHLLSGCSSDHHVYSRDRIWFE